MTQEAHIGGAWRTVQAGDAYIFGAWRRLLYAEAYIGGNWETIATYTTPMSVSFTPPFAAGSAASGSPVTVVTNTVTGVVTGGLGPFSYAWSLVSSSGGETSTASSPAFASSFFSKPSVASGEVWGDTFRLTVTDSIGSTASGDLAVSFSNNGAGGFE